MSLGSEKILALVLILWAAAELFPVALKIALLSFLPTEDLNLHPTSLSYSNHHQQRQGAQQHGRVHPGRLNLVHTKAG